MSKLDDMRAMREARYEASRPRAAKPIEAPEAKRKVPNRDESSGPVPGPAQAGLCGHRAISGRACTRDKGHSANSHRYS